MDELEDKLNIPSPVTRINHPLTRNHKVQLLIKRDDLIHPLLSGNKWRKLKHNLLHFQKMKPDRIISFGGAFSNHLVALAYATKWVNIKSTGYIRSHQDSLSNPTIDLIRSLNMGVQFVKPSTFDFLGDAPENIMADFPGEQVGVVPMGGTNELALIGVGEIMDELAQEKVRPDYLITALGTGGSLAGLVVNAPPNVQLVGLSPFKGRTDRLEGFKFIDHMDNYTIISCADGHGFGAISKDIAQFINQFYDDHQILLDPIYTSRAMNKTLKLIEEGYFEVGSTIVFLHSGGLQGILGYNEALKYDRINLPFSSKKSFPWFEEQNR